MTLHLHECLDLAHCEVFAVSQRYKLIKRAEELVSVSDNFPLVESSACAGDNLGEEVQRIDVLKDIGLAIGDENHVKLIQGLIHKSNIILLNGRVLCAAVGEFGERGEEGFYSRPWHLAKLPGEDSFAPTGAD